jgi:hypothetical protein
VLPASRRSLADQHDEQPGRQGEGPRVDQQGPLDAERDDEGAAGDEADQLRGLDDGVEQGVADDVVLTG